MGDIILFRSKLPGYLRKNKAISKASGEICTAKILKFTRGKSGELHPDLQQAGSHSILIENPTVQDWR